MFLNEKFGFSQKHYRKSVGTNSQKTSSITPNQNLQEMIYRPPINYSKETTSEKNDETFDRPFGFPKNGKNY